MEKTDGPGMATGWQLPSKNDPYLAHRIGMEYIYLLERQQRKVVKFGHGL